MIIQSRYPTFSGASGFMPMPRKIAGSEMRTIEAFTVAMSMPSVVFDRATQR
jgi:hypothetical protein